MEEKNQKCDVAVLVPGEKRLHDLEEKNLFSSIGHRFQGGKETGSPDPEHKDNFRVQSPCW